MAIPWIRWLSRIAVAIAVVVAALALLVGDLVVVVATSAAMGPPDCHRDRHRSIGASGRDLVVVVATAEC